MAEALGLGANVVSFVVVAAQLAKKTYETFSAIKDGPEIVRRVASQINQVYWILEGLRNNKAALDDPALAGHLQVCFNEMSSAAVLVEKLQLSPAERRGGRLWKRLRTFLGEKDLERLNQQLIGVASSLNLRMQGASITLAYDLKSDFRMFSKQIETLNQSVQTRMLSGASRCAGFDNSVLREMGGHSERLDTRLVSVHDDILNLQSVSKTKGDEMLGLLTQVKDLLVDARRRGNKSQDIILDGARSCSVQDGASRFPKNVDPGTEIELSVRRLCGLITHEKSINTYCQDNVNGEICDWIIDDLQVILKHTAEQERGSTHLDFESVSRGQMTARDIKSTLRRFQRAFGQQRLQINRRANRQRTIPGITSETSHSYGKVNVGIGTITLMLEERHRRFNASGSFKGGFTDYVMGVTFLPADPQQFHMIVAKTIQEECRLGGITSISSLAVNHVIPSHSRVFQVVERGLLGELKEMLVTGKASLRDHDEHGASLLFFSMEQPEICKFLIEEGLDVDHVGRFKEVFHYHDRCALQTISHDANWYQKSLEPRQACRRLILEAGADPTLSPDWESVGSYFYDATCFGTPESIMLAFDATLTGHFGTINTRFPDGNTPLLAHCRGEGGGFHVEQLKTLIQRGADITARGQGGRTCLHFCIYNLQFYVAQEIEAIRYLIKQGADPKAVDDEGLSVSTYAYKRLCFTGSLLGHSSYAGDLWDAVLQSCGYDIGDFRCGHSQRKARYVDLSDGVGRTLNYGRSDFEGLWRGRERLCPYWDDQPWPRALELNAAQSCPRCGGICLDSDEESDSEDDSHSETDPTEGGGALLANKCAGEVV
ncbi:hypothetical protein PG985_014958 [Apiospora marii]|uniref:Fungal N-terminal domain-containing protein n=1 Tax=Apiospora marii TaxID=335849 RepID=A0ABR1RJ60_9PEZI